ncbi:MAG: tRNA (guanosine(37)-N1)-methyltransferase TrmD [Ketobacteraceae bacterium]|nr:tRNA (guanosine(37)-N1)-methyltransferase TrmD [Ketobacteraceae bacterium]
MAFAAVTLFPEMFAALQNYGVSSRALKQGLASLTLVNPRDFTNDVHRTVDDRPYGGGPGMVMLPEPVLQAIDTARNAVISPVAATAATAATAAMSPETAPKVVYVSPQGRPFSQALAESVVREGRPLVFVAGRYEGIDERIIELAVDEEWSLGDYVLSGGELPAMVMMDTIIRLIPGVLGHQNSAAEDSFTEGLLDCPHYTRPEDYQGHRVPEVLLSGNHQRIREWRLKQSLGRTWLRRPDMLERKTLTSREQALLDAFREEYRSKHAPD